MANGSHCAGSSSPSLSRQSERQGREIFSLSRPCVTQPGRTNVEMVQCANCGAELRSRSPQARFCSLPPCRRAAEAERLKHAPLCSMPDCTVPSTARGLCKRHWSMARNEELSAELARPCASCGIGERRPGSAYCFRCNALKVRRPQRIPPPQPAGLPPAAELTYDYRGWPICHVCGEAKRSLGNHSTRAHDLSASEYRARYELAANTPLCARDLSQLRARQTVALGTIRNLKPGEPPDNKGRRHRISSIRKFGQSRRIY